MRPRSIVALSQLCEEKISDPQTVPSAPAFVPPRLSAHHQVSNSPGNSPTGSRVSPSECFSLRTDFFDHGKQLSVEQFAPTQLPPEHMAPKRTHWTSPPPPEAPHAQHVLFENRLGHGLALATSHISGGSCDVAPSSIVSPGTISDEGRPEVAESDDVPATLPSNGNSLLNATAPHMMCPSPARVINTTGLLEPRGRSTSRSMIPVNNQTSEHFEKGIVEFVTPKAELFRRSHSGPPIRKTNRLSWPPAPTIKYPVLNIPSASTAPSHCISGFDKSTVFYETTATNSPFPHITPRQSSQQHFTTSTVTDPHHCVSSTPLCDSHNRMQGSEPRPHHVQLEQQERQGLGLRALEHKLSSAQLSESSLDDLETKGDGTRYVPVERPLSRHRSDSRQSIAPVMDTGPYGSSPGPRQSSLAQLAQCQANAKARSTSHSPLRMNAHQRIIAAAALGGTAASPLQADIRFAPTLHRSDSSTPSSVSLPPSPPPTISHPNPDAHAHEECL